MMELNVEMKDFEGSRDFKNLETIPHSTSNQSVMLAQYTRAAGLVYGGDNLAPIHRTNHQCQIDVSDQVSALDVQVLRKFLLL